MLRIHSITISSLRGIRQLNLDFPERCSILCGPNGIGKSTILESIAASINNNIVGFSRMAKSEVGRVTANFQVTPERILTNEIVVRAMFSNEYINSMGRFDANNYEIVSKLIFIKVNRDLPYVRQKTLEADPEFNTVQHHAQTSLIEGINLHSIKRWFSNRAMFEPHGSLSAFQGRNLKLAKGIFSRFDPSVEFDSVAPASLDVILKTSKGNIPFEFLSSGFKSSVLLVLGIIKEIEERFNTQEVDAEIFDGLIMIDEIDVHLHPKWQSAILETSSASGCN
jgi:predicted ATP-binding protein involved in virulence